MAVNPTELEATAAAYEQAAKKLREAAEILRSGVDTSSNGPVAKRLSRVEQIKQWLRDHGPARRTDILNRIGLPRGTVGALLTKKNFDQDDQGRWTLKEEDESADT